LARAKLRIIPLGGVGEIGKNMLALETGGQILVIDCGLMFPDQEMLGVDLVIPETTYLEQNRDRVLGIVLTHGHEDHVGALPYVLPRLNVPVYGTRLTLRMASGRMEELGALEAADLREYKHGKPFSLGQFVIEPFRMPHSIPDGAGLIIQTPVGTLVHSGDFKLDLSPIDGKPPDLARLAQAGQDGVLVLLSDCTNVEKPGYTPSERVVGGALEEAVARAARRVIVATFASNVHRMQQVVDVSVRHGRKVALVGRSMVSNANAAAELGYLRIPEGTLVRLDEVDRLRPEEVTLLTTGSQGEPLSALSRMATAEHKQVNVEPGDLVVISATPIPGNEDLVFRTINHLYRRGAEVVYEPFDRAHVSGHANQEELRLLLGLVKPRYVVPVHGEYRHLVRYRKLAVEQMAYPPERVFVLDLGDVLELTPRTARIAGQVPAGGVMIDGLGVGDVGDVVLRDRKHLSEDGILIVTVTIDRQLGTVLAGPDIISRGFVYEAESEELLQEARGVVAQTIAEMDLEEATEWTTVKSRVRAAVSKFIRERIQRRPMVLPIIMEV